jgi:hypothetical protein
VKIIGVLSWYDEPSWCLAELVASAAKAGMDALVAVDGAYALYPGGRGQSPTEQAQVIHGAAMGAGVELVLHVPRDVWFDNEIEKRSVSLALAHQIAEPGEDWLWILDGDEVITEAIGLRPALEQTELETASVMMEEVLDGSRTGGIVPIRKFFKAQPGGIRLENNHFTFLGADGKLLY